MKLPFSAENFNFSGRIDLSQPGQAMLIWPGSYIGFCFSGTSVGIELENHRFWNGNRLGFVVDGKESFVEIGDGAGTYTLCENLPAGTHNCYIYKPMSGGYIMLINLVLGDGAYICKPMAKPRKRIEFYGDSVTAGDVVDADAYQGMPDPEGNMGQWDNAWHTYAMRVGRMLPAEVYITSQGGIALLDGTGYFEMPNMRGLESCYDKLKYCVNEEITKWDFSRFVPHVIVFAVGQNDHNPNPDCIYDTKHYRVKWEQKYIEIINSIRSHAPKATVVLALTVLNHDPAWDEALEEIKDKMGGEKNRVYHFVYSRCGKATPGHPRNAEQQEMAVELTDFLNSLPQDTWKN